MAKEYVSSVMKLFFLLLQLFFLSQYVDSATIVKYLPGFEGPLPFELETGYIGIGEEENVQLFYYFIKSERNPKEDPLILWLSGGPGCSSIAGLFFENGPVTIKFDVYNGSIPSLVSTTYSWTKISSIIFLDQPVGSGFSYSRKQPLDKSSDSREAKRIHEFLQNWLGKHQDFASNPFYLGGDSYSGKVLPAAVQEISKGNYLCCNPPINLQGYMLGNPLTQYDIEINSRIPFAHGMSLISDELYESLKRTCKEDYVNVAPSNVECLNLVKEYNKGYMLGNPLTQYDIESNSRIPFAHGMALISDELYESLKRTCKEEYVNVAPSNVECLNLVKEYNKCTEGLYKYFISLPFCKTITPNCYDYRYTLNNFWANEKVYAKLYKSMSIKKWIQCDMSMPYNKDIISSVPYYKNISINGYRSLIYSGDHDLAVPFIGTQAWIRSLNYSIIDEWRPWMINDQIAGYTRTYANKMTYATVKGMGHTAEYKPEESFIMFDRWINGQPL